MSSALAEFRSLFCGRAGGWSAVRLLVSPARSRLGGGGRFEVGALGASLGFGDRVAVEVAEDVLLVVAPARGDAGDQHGGEGAKGAVVVFVGGAEPRICSTRALCTRNTVSVNITPTPSATTAACA